ncbi:MAG: NFACT family protein [Candidatus Norongarragalinales archaeon]
MQFFQQLGNLDCFFLAKEMADSLEGSFFENFYDYGGGVFRLRFSKQSILLDLRGFAFVAGGGAFPAPPKQPSSFAMLLRKRLSSAKLEDVKQLGFDRIFEFAFSSKQFGAQFVVVELFGKQGNLLLLDSQRRIIQPFKRVSYSARSLAAGEDYALPPSEKKHPLDLKDGDLQGKGKVVSFLSKQTSLAPFYLEEACARAGVALNANVESLGEGKSGLLKAMASLFENPAPAVFFKGGKPFAFSSVALKKFEGVESVAAESVSQAVASYYASLEKERPKPSGDLEFQLQMQEDAVKGFEAKAVELQSAGKWVFENRVLVGELLAAVKDKGALQSVARKHGLKAGVKKQFLEIELPESGFGKKN